MRLLRDPLFLSVSLNHLLIDILNGQIAIVLVFLSPLLRLSNTDIGLMITIYITTSSLLQPVFGWLSDRLSIHWFGGFGLLWMAAWFAGAILVAGRASLVLLVIGGFGSGMFHPTGTERAATRGRVLMAGRAATAASIFFLFGQSGLAAGPAIGGLLLEEFGLVGLLLICGAAVPIAVNSLWRVRGEKKNASLAAESATAESTETRPNRWLLLAFVLLVITRSIPQQIGITFIPKMLQDQGFSVAAYGAIASLFMTGAALGGVFGGVAADRFGRRRTVFWTLALSIAPFYFLPVTSGLLQYLFIFLAGGLSGASHSIIVVLAQSFMPRRMALASGLTLGFMFTSGSIGAYFAGVAADAMPLTIVLQFNAILVVIGALLSLSLGQKRPTPISVSVRG